MNDMDKTTMEKNGMMYLIGGVVLVLLLFFVGQKMKKSSDMKTGANPATNTAPVTTANKSSLTISAPSTKMKVNGTQVMKVTLSDSPVAAIDVSLTYDPELLELSNVKKSTSFPQQIQSTIDAKKGILLYSSSVDPSKQETTAQGEVFTFTVKAKKISPSAKIDFNTVDTIAAVNGENMLSSTKGVILEITK